MPKAIMKSLTISFGLLLLMCAPVRTADAFVFQDRIATYKAVAHYAMGQVFDLLGQTTKAVQEYEMAAQFDEASYLIHLRLGADYARLDMLTKAKDELQLVGKYNPDDLQSHYLLALIHSTEKDYDAAAHEYEYILKTFSEAEPGNIEIYGYLGQLYYSQKKYKNAIEQFEKILQLEPDNPDVLYLLGSLYLEIDDQRKAIEMLKESIKIKPNHDGSLNTLGYIYAESNQNLAEAESLVLQALEESPNNGAYLDSLGWVYYKREKYQEALDAFERANAVMKDPVIYEHMGDVYYKRNQFEKAIEYWELSLDLLPDQKSVIKKIDAAKSIQVRNTEESSEVDSQ